MSQRRRRRADPVDLTSLLEGQLARIDGDRARLLAAWQRAAGPDLAPHAVPVDIRHETLRLRCASGVWASEIQLMSDDLLPRLRTELPGVQLDRVSCRIGRIHVADRPVDEPEPIDPAALPARSSARVRSLVEQLPAGDVRDRVDRALRAATARREPG